MLGCACAASSPSARTVQSLSTVRLFRSSVASASTVVASLSSETLATFITPDDMANEPAARPKANAPESKRLAKVSRASVSSGSSSPSAAFITSVSASGLSALNRPSLTAKEPLPESVATMPAMLRPCPAASTETSSLPEATGRPVRSQTSACNWPPVRLARSEADASPSRMVAATAPFSLPPAKSASTRSRLSAPSVKPSSSVAFVADDRRAKIELRGLERKIDAEVRRQRRREGRVAPRAAVDAGNVARGQRGEERQRDRPQIQRA